IVWWRAWVLWPHSRVVRAVCVAMITVTTGSHALRVLPLPPHDSIPPASLFAGDVWGVITVICSLSTNFVATALIGYRAWKHRSLIISTMGKSSGRTQVERTLALLVESGLLYCVIWVSSLLLNDDINRRNCL
ncbi:hypothetical protein K466DRAFT_490131, partial [Polyporus arcularius HHB13444]